MRNTIKSWGALVLMAVATYAIVPIAQAEELAPLWKVEGMDQPESVVAGPDGQLLYVSNINGQPVEMNGQGYISKLSVDGQVVDKHWVEGLDAPKGMAVSQGLLYVADMQTLHVINMQQGSVVKHYQAPDAKMLNDVTVGESGEVYVSDLLGGAIYRLKEDRFDHWLANPKLPHPNGLLWHNGELYIANWGEGMKDDFTTREPGTLYRLDVASKTLKAVATGYHLGNLDGVVAMDSQLYISDWITGELYRLSGNERHKVLQLTAGLADIGSAGNGVIYAPMMMDNHIIALKPQ
ncbi:SMP-30/gluconolactonase/LRE family protein [Alkalimarinus coralli]|uniref:SMP-30/gluconolactonase/LRE family protein n=1 Tax=Alkalimarinus coralli TaxID=2935863 RepID=UPI00202B0FC8|nr:hypothetical protein [Alkalimarinus coralli]